MRVVDLLLAAILVVVAGSVGVVAQDCTTKTVTRLVPTTIAPALVEGPDGSLLNGPYTFKCGSILKSYKVQKFDFVAPVSGKYVADTSALSSGCTKTADTVIEVRSGGCTGPVLGCNDDVTNNNMCSAVVFNVKAGAKVTILVSMYRGLVDIQPFVLQVKYVETPKKATKSPTNAKPTRRPTSYPTRRRPRTANPSKLPTRRPTLVPTPETPSPSNGPSEEGMSPTDQPTSAPTRTTTTSAPSSRAPTSEPSSKSPTSAPTRRPTTAPTSKLPTATPTRAPSTRPPTRVPTSPTSTSQDPSLVFNIEFALLNPVPDAQMAAFNAAKIRLESIIREDSMSTVYIPANTAFCELPASPSQRAIDDLLIVVDISNIDGAGGILGRAGPCGFSSNGQIRVGYMQFDSTDVNGMISSGTFTAVVLHEMLHVLGIGSMWGNLVTPETNGAPFYYLGDNGNAAFNAMGGVNRIVVEDSGGSGTRRVHWDEATYDNELMTGYIGGSTNPLSRFTVAALVDLGYRGVNLDAADAYTIPAASGRRLRTPTKDGQYDHIHDDVWDGPLSQLPETPKPGREAAFQQEVKAFQTKKRKPAKPKKSG